MTEAPIENPTVIVTDNLVTQVSTEPLATASGQVIDGSGRTMIPGLIDAHWPISYCCAKQSTVVTGDVLEIAIRDAIVQVAETWTTYVAAHIFTDKATQAALKAGVLSIEHGNLLSEETQRMMMEKGAWLSVQPLIHAKDALPSMIPSAPRNGSR